MTLRKQVLAGSAYSLAGQATVFAAQFAAGIVLARLLAPSDFGIIAIALVVSSFANIIQGMGLSSAVIQKRMTDPDALNTAFTLNALLVLVLLPVILLWIAPAWGQWYNVPELVTVVRVQCLFLLFSAVLFIPNTVCQVHMRFGVLSAATMIGAMAGSLLSVVLAYVWRNYWALVCGQLVGGVVLVVILLWLAPYRPRLRFDGKKAAVLFSFGKILFCLHLLTFVTRQADKVIGGRVLDIDTLGVYFQAQKWGSLAVVTMIMAVQRVFFSAYSHKKNDRVALVNAFGHSVLMSFSLIAPCSVGLALIAPDFVTFVLGERWLPAVTPMRCFALLSIFRLFVSLIAPVFLAIGRPELSLRASLITKPILLVAVAIFAREYGLIGIVAAVGLDHFLMLVLFIVMNRKHVGLPLASAAGRMRVPLVLSLVMVPVWWAFQGMVPGLWRMGLTILACAATYAVLYTAWFRLTSWQRLLEFARQGPDAAHGETVSK